MPGEKVIGPIVEIDTRESQYGEYPLIIIDAGDHEVAVHGFGAVLQRELARKAPKVGDRIAIAYHGVAADKGYKLFRVAVERAEPEPDREVDWEAIGRTAEAELADVEPQLEDDERAS